MTRQALDPTRATSRSRLSREAIVGAALEIVERDGLDALSLRGVAARLGVTPMPLYRHVATRDDLVDAVVERLLEERDDSQPWPDDWEELLRFVAVRTHQLLLTHPLVYDAVRRRALTAEPALRGLEHLLKAFTSAGFSSAVAIEAYNAVLLHVLGHVALVHGRMNALRMEGRTADQERDRVHELLAALPEEHFPLVRAAAADVITMLDEDVFLRGLDRIIVGFRAEAERGVRSRRAR